MHLDSASCVAIAVLMTVGTGSFVDPKKGTLSKWLYWAIVPIVVAALLAVATRNFLAGLALGSIFYLILAGGYVRFYYDKR